MTARDDAEDIIKELEAQGNADNVVGMARYGIRGARIFGVSLPWLRQRAKTIGRNHDLALALWATGAYEARLLAGLVDDPRRVTPRQMEEWASGFDSWALCDGTCCNLFDRTEHAWDTAGRWARRPEEFVKRAGFVLVAGLATHDRRAPDERFLPFLPVIEAEAVDSRVMVKKGVNWALRHIGKRNLALHAEALVVATRLAQTSDAASRWVGRDARRELSDERIVERIRRREGRR